MEEETTRIRYTRWEDRTKSQKCKIIVTFIGIALFIVTIVSLLAFFCVFKPHPLQIDHSGRLH